MKKRRLNLHKKIIKQPNVLFIQFGKFTGKVLAPAFACTDKDITIGIASIYYDRESDLSVPPQI